MRANSGTRIVVAESSYRSNNNKQSCRFSFKIKNVVEFGFISRLFIFDYNNFNSFHPRLKFMMKIGGTSLNFFKLKIINRDGQLMFGWYHKPTFSDRILNYHSKHPIAQKRGVIN